VKHNKLYLLSFLLFFYLFSSYAESTHIHHDPFASHSDCKLCQVAEDLHSGTLPETDFLPSVERASFAQIEFFQRFITFSIYKGFDAHAPPSFS